MRTQLVLFDELRSWLDESKLAEEIESPDDFFEFIGLEQTLGKPEESVENG